MSAPVCFKKAVEDFWDVHFSCVKVEGRGVNSNVDCFSSFSGNVFAVLVYYLEVEDVGSGMVVGNAGFVNCTDDITTVSFYSILQTSAGFSYVKKASVIIYAGLLVDYVLF